MIRDNELGDAFAHAVCSGAKGERIRTADIIKQAQARGIHLTPEEANAYLARAASGVRLIAEGRHNLTPILKSANACIGRMVLHDDPLWRIPAERLCWCGSRWIGRVHDMRPAKRAGEEGIALRA